MGLILLPFVFLLMATLFSVTRGLKTLNFLFPVPHMVCYQGLCVKSISVVLFTFARFKAMLNSNRHHWVRALSTFHPAFCLVTSSGLFPVPVQLWYHFSAPNSSVSLGLWGKSKLFTQTCKNLLKSHSSNLSLFTITELCSMSTFHASVDSMVWPSHVGAQRCAPSLNVALPSGPLLMSLLDPSNVPSIPSMTFCSPGQSDIFPVLSTPTSLELLAESCVYHLAHLCIAMALTASLHTGKVLRAMRLVEFKNSDQELTCKRKLFICPPVRWSVGFVIFYLLIMMLVMCIKVLTSLNAINVHKTVQRFLFLSSSVMFTREPLFLLH